MIRLIAAIDSERGIANERGIPWQGKIPMDTNFFHEQTVNGMIIMGYRTYQEYEKPVHDRENFVVTRPDSKRLRPGFAAVTDLAAFLRQHAAELVWVIGGAALFSASLAQADQLLLTTLHADFHCTKFFPTFTESFELKNDRGPFVENDISFDFQIWQSPKSSADNLCVA